MKIIPCQKVFTGGSTRDCGSEQPERHGSFGPIGHDEVVFFFKPLDKITKRTVCLEQFRQRTELI